MTFACSNTDPHSPDDLRHRRRRRRWAIAIIIVVLLMTFIEVLAFSLGVIAFTKTTFAAGAFVLGAVAAATAAVKYFAALLMQLFGISAAEGWA